MSDTFEELRLRILRLEAKECCISTLNEYLYCLDGEFTEDLLGLFAPNARLEIVNYPPGTGENLNCTGREEIRPIFESHHGILTRHHAANITVNIRPCGKTADMSAYFITALNYGLSGGLYEARLKQIEDKWLFSWLRICSNWGWILPQEYPPFLADSLAAGALRKGRPVRYVPRNPA